MAIVYQVLLPVAVARIIRNKGKIAAEGWRILGSCLPDATKYKMHNTVKSVQRKMKTHFTCALLHKKSRNQRLYPIHVCQPVSAKALPGNCSFFVIRWKRFYNRKLMKLYTMTEKLMSHAEKRKGSVTFVGCAARLIVSTGTFAMAAIASRIKFCEVSNTVTRVSGSTIPMLPMKAIPSHKNLLLSCRSHQLMNLVNKLILRACASWKRCC